MKKIYLLLCMAITGSLACRRPLHPVRIDTSTNFKKGVSLFNQNSDSAFLYFNEITEDSKDSTEIAMAYYYMAAIQSDAGDYFGGQESLLTSLKYLNDKKDKDQYCLQSDYNDLANNSLNLRNYDAAVYYCDKALQLIKDIDSKIITSNNLGVAYEKKRDYVKAIRIYQSIIDSSKNYKKEYARILSNLAKTRWLQDHQYNALPEMLTALQIRKEIGDNWGMNASYAHLADYYLSTKPDSALIYATRMYTIAQALNSPDDEMEALQKLIVLSPVNAVKQYFIRYQSLSDSLQTARNGAKNQFALIRYETEKSKADNLRLQKDIAESHARIFQLWLAIGGMAVLAGLGYGWFRRRKERLKQEANNAIREYELKTSQKVHDVVANGLYRIMTGIEHGQIADKEELLDKIEILYEQSRDISYEHPHMELDNFQLLITDLLQSFATPSTKVLVAGNNEYLWNRVGEKVKKEFQHVLQELMINMKKHSQAETVVVRFLQQGDHISVLYKDDGIGLSPNFQKKNGLTNTGNRIKSIGGRLLLAINCQKESR